MNQTPILVDVIGFPGSGKTAVVQLLKTELETRGYSVYASQPYQGKSVPRQEKLPVQERSRRATVYDTIRTVLRVARKPKVYLVAVGFWFWSISKQNYGFRQAYKVAKRLRKSRQADEKVDVVLEDTSRSSVLVTFFSPAVIRLLPDCWAPHFILAIDALPSVLWQRVQTRQRPGDKHQALDKSTFLRVAELYQRRMRQLGSYLQGKGCTTVLEIDGTANLQGVLNEVMDSLESALRMRQTEKNSTVH